MLVAYQEDKSRAENVSRVEELCLYPRRNGHCRRRVFDRRQQAQRVVNVALGIERQGRIVACQMIAVPEVSVLLLEMRAVRKKNPEQFGSSSRTVDRSLKVQLDQSWQIARTIEMRVREHDRIDAVRIERRGLPVPLAKLLEPLEQPAVHQHAASARLHQVLRPGNGTDAAPERECSHHSPRF